MCSSDLTATKTIVTVASTPITTANLEHWLTVTAKIEDTSGKSKGKAAPTPPTYSACIAGLQRSNAKETAAQAKAKCESEYVALERRVLGFLISSDWIRGEAAHLHLTVSREENKERLDELKGNYYPKGSRFKAFLASSGETMADVLWRTEGELLEAQLSEEATKGRTRTTEEHVVLKEYDEALAARWKSRTNCSPGYVVEDCEQFKTPPPATTPQEKEEHVYHEELHEKKEFEKEGKETEIGRASCRERV